MKSFSIVLYLALGTLFPGPLRAADPIAEVKLELIREGAMQKLGGYMPQQLKLDSTKPATLKKSPDVTAPLYGSIQFAGVKHLVLLDEPDGADAKLYIDANANGDLTDDPHVEWKTKEYGGVGKKLTQYTGNIKLPLGKDEKAPIVTLGAYRFDKNDAQRAPFKSTIFYYRDYMLDGQIKLGERSYHARLTDDKATGDFAATGPDAPQLMIDRNGDGNFNYRSEIFDPSKAFSIDGTVWKITDRTVDGKIQLATSVEKVDEIPPPPDHTVGKTITAFKAMKMDGTEVNFPADYKGKIVMLVFWATWCGPCMAEMPGLTKAYQEFRPKGIEILGISLDQPKSDDKVKSVTAEKNMTWPQVYDGKGWQAEIATLYGINSIPAAYLVDGDTGKVLATGETLRGAALEETFKKALAEKAKK
jgi:peroxiredoxin